MLKDLNDIEHHSKEEVSLLHKRPRTDDENRTDVEAEPTEKVSFPLRLRPYQQKVLDAALRRNTLVSNICLEIANIRFF